MKPSQLIQSLKRIASGIEASSQPDRALVIHDLKNIIIAMEEEPVQIANEISGVGDFVWTTSSGSFLIQASDEDEALRRVIAHRMSSGKQSLEEALDWFHKDDSLVEIDGIITDEPYEGEIPEEES